LIPIHHPTDVNDSSQIFGEIMPMDYRRGAKGISMRGYTRGKKGRTGYEGEKHM